ncbi:MAG: kelch repeat-containing protein [Deltaproteobacteria bacterium]
MSFSTVPHGTTRFVLVELREAPTADSRVLYYGRSEAFDLSAGSSLVVPVLVEMTAVPEVASGVLTVEEDDGQGFVRSADVTLRLQGDPALGLRVSNFLGSLDAATGIALDSLPSVPGAGPNVRTMPWSMDEGYDDACARGAPSNFCPRQVFARFVDENGYRSNVVTATVTVDTKPPDVDTTATVLRLTPDEANSRDVVTVARAGTHVRIELTVDEPVRDDSRLTLSSNPPVVLDLVSNGGRILVFEVVLPSDVDDGLYGFDARLMDRAGHRTETRLDTTLRVDSTAPRAPLTGLPGRVTHHRAPWGRRDARPPFYVLGLDDSVEAGVTVIARRPDVGEIGRTEADSRGGFLIPIGADADVELVAIDAAGNQSGAAPVREVRWSATMRGKLPGDTAQNPHELVESRGSRPTLYQAGAQLGEPLTDADLRRLDQVDGEGVRPRLGMRLEVEAFDSPIDVGWHATVYDVRRGRRVTFGGAEHVSSGRPRYPVGVTWIEDSTPRMITPQPAPPARWGHRMAYDSVRDRVVLFGGTASNEQGLADTWELADETWILRTPVHSPPRFGQITMAYDAKNATTLLLRSEGTDWETWAWDGDDWTQLHPSASPPSQTIVEMVYDVARGEIIAVAAPNGGALQHWAWDGENWRQDTGVSMPSPRSFFSLGYDRTRNVVVMHGGAGNGAYLDDTWRWDGNVWVELPTVDRPPVRRGATLVYDASTEGLVLLGGYVLGEGFGGEAWGLAGSNWVQHRGPDPVAPQITGGFLPSFTAVFDPALGEVIVNETVLGELWSWDGQRWTLHPPPTPAPPGRVDARSVYAGALGGHLLFGGVSGSVLGTAYDDTWLWSAGAWTQISGAAPSARVAPGLVYDPGREEVVLFGGVPQPGAPALTDTWSFDGVWQLRPSPIAPGGIDGMAFDAVRGVAVLVHEGVTWEWSSTWTERTDVAPIAADVNDMTFDARRGRVVATAAGSTGEVQLHDYDGVRWRQQPAGSPQPAVANDMLVHDARRGRNLVVRESNQYLSAESALRPALVFRVDWSGDRTSVDRITFAAVAGASGADPTSLLDTAQGVQVFAWDADAGVWRSVAVSTDGADAPADVSATLVGEDAQRYLLGDDAYFMLQPRGVTYGPREAELLLDFIAVEIAYAK